MALVISGCPEDEAEPEMIIGDWEADDPVCGDGATMEVEDDLDGEARLYFYYNNECSFADFKIEVEIVDSQSRYDIDFEADDPPDSALDFTMECDVDGDELDCEGDDIFAEFEWTFERE